MYSTVYSFPSVFVVLGVESSKVVESQLADFLVLLRRVLSLRVMKRLSTFSVDKCLLGLFHFTYHV